jgi:hypothetical protein
MIEAEQRTPAFRALRGQCYKQYANRHFLPWNRAPREKWHPNACKLHIAQVILLRIARTICVCSVATLLAYSLRVVERESREDRP